MLWSGQALYVGVTVQDDDVDGWRRDLAKDAPVFRRDGLELLLKPNREARECFRIAVSPNGQLYDSRFDRIEGPNAVLGGWLEHVEWESGVRVVGAVAGTNSDPSDRDEGYVLELAVPWNTITPEGASEQTPSSKWSMELSVLDRARAWHWASDRVPAGGSERLNRLGMLKLLE